ncbi:MAG: hypothetical protein F2803_05870, partial [Actinobacteria bacterium]|nr:hypothetical protein [Actinomycetota bacterium]
MLKRLASATRITTAILMVVSILMPTSIAEASGNITKAVTVRGINGQPYEGASVTLKYEPTSGSKDKTVYLDPVTTLQNGVASLTFPDNLKGATLIIQPPASDTVTATYTNYGENWGISTPVTINLIKRNATINILKPNGDSVGAGAGIWVAEGAFYQLIRGGNTGISVDPTTATDTCLRTEVYPPDTLQDSFSRAYGVKVVGSGDSRVLSFYNDVATCLNETPKINGVYQLKLNPANVSGTLKNSSGQAITFGPGEGYKVQIWGLNQDGTNDWSKVASGSFSTSNGGWTGFIDTSTAGTFEIVFSGYGGANFPYFANNYIYVTADHKLSWISATDTSGSNTAIRDFNIPQANFSIRTFDSATATLIDSTFEFRKKTTNPNETRFMGYTSVLGSATSASLSNGDYVVQAYGFPNGNPTIEFTVLGSEITVTSSTDLGSGWTYTRSGNNFTLTSRPSNAKLKIVDVNGAGVGANIQFVGVINSRKVSKWAHTDNLGNADLYLVNGTYNYVYIEPDNSSINGSIRTTATVVDGVLTMATGNHETDGSWTLQLPINNLLLNVVYPNNSPLYDANLNPLAWINFWNADANWNSTTQASNPQIGADGKAGAFLPNGRYILDLELRTDAEVTSNNGFASRKYRVTVASDVITITSDGLPITPVDSVFTISP